MKTKIIYNCEICNKDFHVDLYESDEKAKQACLDCENKGIADSSKIDTHVIYQKDDKDLFYCVDHFRERNHYIDAYNHMTRNNIYGDTLGGDGYYLMCNILAKTNKEFYSKYSIKEFNSAFLRMINFLKNEGKIAKYWDGEEIKIVDDELIETLKSKYEKSNYKDASKEDDSILKNKSLDEVENFKNKDFEIEDHFYKVSKPDKDSIIFKRKAVYFTDFAYSPETQKEEVGDILRIFKLYSNIEFQHDIRITVNTPFDLTFGILFFDYGGVMNGYGSMNTVVYDNCKLLVEDAKKNPQRDYIITSTFSEFENYMKEAMTEFGYYADNLNNIYFGVKEFLKKNNYYKE